MKYAVRPSTTAAKTNCATRRMRERRRVKIILVVADGKECMEGNNWIGVVV
jgi:hypothetical protein